MKNYKIKGIVVNSDTNISPYSKDIESELTKILSEQLASEIDKEILKNLSVFERPIKRKNSVNKIFK